MAVFNEFVTVNTNSESSEAQNANRPEKCLKCTCMYTGLSKVVKTKNKHPQRP